MLYTTIEGSHYITPSYLDELEPINAHKKYERTNTTIPNCRQECGRRECIQLCTYCIWVRTSYFRVQRRDI